MRCRNVRQKKKLKRATGRRVIPIVAQVAIIKAAATTIRGTPVCAKVAVVIILGHRDHGLRVTVIIHSSSLRHGHSNRHLHHVRQRIIHNQLIRVRNHASLNLRTTVLPEKMLQGKDKMDLQSVIAVAAAEVVAVEIWETIQILGEIHCHRQQLESASLHDRAMTRYRQLLVRSLPDCIY